MHMQSRQDAARVWNTCMMESKPRTQGSEARSISQPPTSTTALTRPMAANLASRERPFRSVLMLVLSLLTSPAVPCADASSLGFCSCGADSASLQRMTCRVRAGSACGSCAGGIDVSLRQSTRRSGGGADGGIVLCMGCEDRWQ